MSVGRGIIFGAPVKVLLAVVTGLEDLARRLSIRMMISSTQTCKSEVILVRKTFLTAWLEITLAMKGTTYLFRDLLISGFEHTRV